MLRENMRLIAECSQQLVRLGENLWGKEQKLDKVEPLDVPTMTTDFVKEHGLPCPDGYIFKDENGNVINAQKIVLEKVNTLKTQSDNMETETHRGYYTTEEETTNKSKKVAWFTFGDNDFADKVELDLSNRKLIQEDGKWFVVKKKEYPKTYEECCGILKEQVDVTYGYKKDVLHSFQKLLVCRDAYWKIAGEEMGLAKSWNPISAKGYCTYAIIHHTGHIRKSRPCADSALLEFPAEEMRDAFYENFKELIETVKELL